MNAATEIKVMEHKLQKVLNKLALIRLSNGLRSTVLITGPAGAGKSTAAKRLADRAGLPFYFQATTILPTDIIGYRDPHTGEWRKTEFVRAFTEGGVYIGEEFDAWSPNATLAWNTPVANGYIINPVTGELIHRHPDCIILAAANTWGTGATMEYVGRNKMDAATLDRFNFRIEWKYDTLLEQRMLPNDVQWVAEAVQHCRNNAQKAGLKIMITPRASLAIAALVEQGHTFKEAAEYNFLAGLTQDQRSTVLNGVQSITSVHEFEDDGEDWAAVFKEGRK